MSEVTSIEELKKNYPDEWIIFEVINENEFEEPTEGRLIAHSKVRDEIYDSLKRTEGDICMIFTGDIPKKGYAVVF